VSAATATPALRGIDLPGHHHTWPGPGKQASAHAGLPVRDKPERENEQPGQA
jgi:hypothetical protein